MNKTLAGVLAIVILVPAIFVLEAYIHGGPATVSENTRSVRNACLGGGGGQSHCDCVAKEFESKLDLNDIIWRRITFVRETIPNKQELYEEAELSCRNRIG